jgi:hypothetical protein
MAPTTASESNRRAVGSSLHSWELITWPPEVWPHEPSRAAWLARTYRKELIDAGALTRIGKRLVFIGAGYTRWQQRRARHVVEFTSNNAEIGKPKPTKPARRAASRR